MIIRFVTSWCVCVVIKAFKSYCIASNTVKAKDLELSSWSLFFVLLWTLNIPASDLNQSNKQFSWFTSPNVLVTFYRADASVQFLSIPLFNLNAGIAPSAYWSLRRSVVCRHLIKNKRENCALPSDPLLRSCLKEQSLLQSLVCRSLNFLGLELLSTGYWW